MLTTTTYGDFFPLTTGGKLVNLVVAVAAYAIFAIPSGVVAWGFIEMHYESKLEVKGWDMMGQQLLTSGRLLTLERQLDADGRLYVRERIAPLILFLS